MPQKIRRCLNEINIVSEMNFHFKSYSQQGTLNLPDTWFRPFILGLACAPIVEIRFFELAMSLFDFSPRMPLATFSILLNY